MGKYLVLGNMVERKGNFLSLGSNCRIYSYETLPDFKELGHQLDRFNMTLGYRYRRTEFALRSIDIPRPANTCPLVDIKSGQL